jgi:hypothetical protein
MELNEVWKHWQGLLAPFAEAFTYWGFQRFREWIIGLVLNVEEHTITQSLMGLGRPADWKALEAFAEKGSWDQDTVERVAAELIDEAPDRQWHGFRVWAVDDSKVHRSSAHVWGTCTYHEYTARCPNRATTVRAHNWVVIGALLPRDEQPAWFLPHTGRLYFRQSQLPAGETFRTKCELAVELLRREALAIPGKHLGVFDGAFAVASVVRRLVRPEEAADPQVDFLTRLRGDARLHAWIDREAPRPAGQRGPRPKWGRPLPPPRQGGRWPEAWREGTAWIYGRRRQVRWKELLCQWRVTGHDVLVKVVVAQVEGYRKRFTLVSSATHLTGLQLVELFAARFRQEDGFRDLKQRLGWEECRAWTKEPILRTSQAELLAMTLLRLLQFRLEEAAGDEWWYHPPWNKRKKRPSVLDLQRLLWLHRQEIGELLSCQLGT